MTKKLFILLFPTVLFSAIANKSLIKPQITDPFSNVTENLKDITVSAICHKNGQPAQALITIQGTTELVSKDSIISSKNGQWKVLHIKENSITIRHLTSGKEYCLTI